MTEKPHAPLPLPTTLSRAIMLRWTGWFGIANGAILLLIGSRYVFAIPLPSDALAWGYMAMASVSQFALLATLPLFLLCSPLVLFKARRRWVSGMGIIVGALLLTLLILDTNIFDQYRYHMSGLTIAIFETSTWFFAGIVFCSMLVFEFMLAGVVWQFCLQPQHGKTGVWLAVVLVSLGLTGQVVHVWADATSYVPVTQFTRVLPLYYPLKAKRSLMKFGLLDEAEMQRLRSINLAKIPDGGQLNYPLAPLQCSATALPNILFVVVDAMRRDHIAPELTPTLAQFATESLDFRNHYSGGNSSRMGFFSMFYGMPSTYWQTFYSAQESPVFMRQINSAGYQMALFSGVGFGSPSQIDRTVFADNQQSLQAVEGLDDAASIRAVTDGFTDWLAAYDRNSPFFGLLYFDPGSSWKAPAGVDESALSEAEVVHAGYRRGLRLIDAEVERVLAALDAAGVVDDTLVIIASDHGYEFDELGLGYIGHASNFSRWQLMSTLMLRWPGKEPMVYTHRSAHQDLPVTLLQEVFDCSNPPTEYASGKSLFDTVDWDWLVAGSYNAYAIVQPDKVVVTYPGGRTEVLDETYKPSNELTIDVPVVQDVMLEMTRFYQ